MKEGEYMHSDERFTMYRLAYRLVAEGGFDILHIDSGKEEIWLEKLEKKTSKVVRLIHKGFDWRNHLNRDIADVFRKAQAMRKNLLGKHIELYNVYASAYAPVDDWEMLKKPMQLNEKKLLRMRVYYMSQEDLDEEADRLQKDLELAELPRTEEDDLETYQKLLNETMLQKRKETERVFSNGKPFFTYILIAINVLLFIMLEMNGGSTDIQTLIEMGAKYNPAIMDGEWWRIVTSVFLHIGFLHIFMNMLAVYYLGIAVEQIFGRFRFLFIYLLAGIGGGFASFAFTQSLSAGASGAVFGLFGALLFFGLMYRRIFQQTMGRNIIFILILNLVIGFNIDQIDMAAHIGGLAAGFVASAIVGLPSKRKLNVQLLGILIYAALIGGLLYVGVDNNNNSQLNAAVKIEEMMAKGEYEEIIVAATDALDKEGDLEAQILFYRSYAHIELGNTDEAIHDLEKSLEYEKDMAEAHYNLAYLHYNSGSLDKASEHVRKAYDLNPEDEGFRNLYRQITGENPE